MSFRCFACVLVCLTATRALPAGEPRAAEVLYCGEIPPSQFMTIRYIGEERRLELEHLPEINHTDQATAAIALSPAWIREMLSITLNALPSDVQDQMAAMILEADDPRIIDEIAFCVAHSSAEELQANEFVARSIVENAKLVYQADEMFEHVQLVERLIDDREEDYYTTARYRLTNSDGTETFHEIPRNAYYWYVVHPALSPGAEGYVDPLTGEVASPLIGGVSWRDYLLFEAPEPERKASIHAAMRMPNRITQEAIDRAAPATRTALTEFTVDPLALIVDRETGAPVLSVFSWPGGQFDGNVIATTIPLEHNALGGDTTLLENLLLAGNGGALFDPRRVGEGLVPLRFALLKDRDPFGEPIVETTLAALGVAYDVFSSDRIHEILQSEQEYLKIIIPSGQPRSLYERLEQEQEPFEEWMKRDPLAWSSVIQFHGAGDPRYPDDDWAGIQLPWGFSVAERQTAPDAGLLPGGYPRLSDVLGKGRVTWNRKPLNLGSHAELSAEATALERIGYFVTQNQQDRCAEVPPYYRGPDNQAVVDGDAAEFVQELRSKHSQRALYLHFGNCGEIMYLLSAASRAALVPIRNVVAHCVDHVWNDVFMDGKWRTFTAFRSDGGVRFDNGVYEGKRFSAMSVRPDGYITNAIADYCDETVTLKVTVRDSRGNPVDGATVDVLSHWNKGEPPPKKHAMVAWTDLEGRATVELGTERDFFVQVYSPLGSWPEGTLGIDAHRALERKQISDVDYPAPSIAIKLEESTEAGLVFHKEVVLEQPGNAPKFRIQRGRKNDGQTTLSLSVDASRAIMHGYSTYYQTRFLQDVPAGSVDVLLLDPKNLNKMQAGKPFVARAAFQRVQAEDLVFQLPDPSRDWYVVLSNRHRISHGQVVDVRAALDASK